MCKKKKNPVSDAMATVIMHKQIIGILYTMITILLHIWLLYLFFATHLQTTFQKEEL